MADRSLPQIVQYLPDVVCLILAVSVAYLLAGKPTVDLRPRPAPAAQAVQTGQPAAAAKKQNQRPVPSPVREDKDLKARNIFTATGAYTDADNKPIPANPYTLIGVIQGKETKAIFKDYTGAVLTMTKGQKMMDGAVIASIEGVTVKLQKGKEKTEMKAFDVFGRKKAEPPPPAVAATKVRPGIPMDKGRQKTPEVRKRDQANPPRR